MRKLLRKIINIIAWVALIVGVIMVLWRVFGKSPTDLAVISPFVVFGLAKIWTINSELKDFKLEVKLSFSKVREDMKRIESKVEGLNKRRDTVG